MVAQLNSQNSTAAGSDGGVAAEAGCSHAEANNANGLTDEQVAPDDTQIAPPARNGSGSVISSHYESYHSSEDSYGSHYEENLPLSTLRRRLIFSATPGYRQRLARDARRAGPSAAQNNVMSSLDDISDGGIAPEGSRRNPGNWQRSGQLQQPPLASLPRADLRSLIESLEPGEFFGSRDEDENGGFIPRPQPNGLAPNGLVYHHNVAQAPRGNSMDTSSAARTERTDSSLFAITSDALRARQRSAFYAQGTLRSQLSLPSPASSHIELRSAMSSGSRRSQESQRPSVHWSDTTTAANSLVVRRSPARIPLVPQQAWSENNLPVQSSPLMNPIVDLEAMNRALYRTAYRQQHRYSQTWSDTTYTGSSPSVDYRSPLAAMIGQQAMSRAHHQNGYWQQHMSYMTLQQQQHQRSALHWDETRRAEHSLRDRRGYPVNEYSAVTRTISQSVHASQRSYA